jgi:CheY-like chemotaxis protein
VITFASNAMRAVCPQGDAGGDRLPAVRIVLADDDACMRDLVEAVVTSQGHTVAGAADSAVAGVRLIETSRPDVLILDLSVSANSDYDIIAAANEIGAHVIVFSHHTDTDLRARYGVAPTVVAKPDLTALEHVLVGLERGGEDGPVEEDRRHRPTHAASGPIPTGIGDAQAFFEAINGARPGDVIVSVDLSGDTTTLANDVARLMRGTDRLLAFPHTVRFYLPGGGQESIRSLLRRASVAGAIPPGCRAESVVVGEDEHGADAFERLKQGGEEQPLPPPPG